MVQLSFIGSGAEQVNIPVERSVTDSSTNSIYLYFGDDDSARVNEAVLREHGFKTEHTEETVRVLNAADYKVVAQ